MVVWIASSYMWYQHGIPLLNLVRSWKTTCETAPFHIGKARERLVLFLKRTLYGLRRAPLAWFRTMHDAFWTSVLTKTSEVTVFRFTGYLKESRRNISCLHWSMWMIYCWQHLILLVFLGWLRVWEASLNEIDWRLPARVVGSLTFLEEKLSVPTMMMPFCGASFGLFWQDWSGPSPPKRVNLFQGPSFRASRSVFHGYIKPYQIGSMRWWFQFFFIFTPTRGNDPIWLIVLKEATN